MSRLGLSWRDVKDLGPYELALTLRGARERQRDQLRETAWLVSTMINMWSSTKTSPAELLGEEDVIPGGVNDLAALEEAERAAAARREEKARTEAATWAEDLDGFDVGEDDAETLGGVP